MACNSNITELDPNQISRRTFDVSNDSVRVTVGSAQFTVEGEGLSASGSCTQGSSGQAIHMTSSAGIKEFQMYATCSTATTGSLTVRIDVSPSASGSPVYQSSTTLTIPASALNTVYASTILNTLIAQTAQVTITANTLNAGETVTIYLVGNSF
jgi:hypothetical protein